MANASKHGALLYSEESSFGETSTSFTLGLPIIGEIDLTGLTQEKQSLDPVIQYLGESVQDVRMTQSGSFTVALYLTGHGSAVASGAVTANQYETFLGSVLGGINAAQTGTAVASGASASQFDVTGGQGSQLVDGAMIKLGALGDGDGESQFYGIDTISTDTVTTLNEAAGTPAAAQTVFAPVNLYPTADPTSTTMTSFRFEALTANAHVQMHGCIPTALEWSGFSPGELPMVTVTISVSRWTTASSTFPQTGVTIDRFAPAPVTTGSLFINTHGTAARTVYSVREFNFSTAFNSQLIPGPASGNEHQLFVDARRLDVVGRAEIVIDTETTGTYSHGDRWNTSEISVAFEHFVYTMTCARDGASLALMFRKAKMIGPRPLQFNLDGLNRQRLVYESVTDTSGTNDLTRSGWILASG